MIHSGYPDCADHRVDLLRHQVTIRLGDILLSTSEGVIPIDQQNHYVADHLVFDQERVDGYAARGEQAVLFKIEAWDINCPQHIRRKLDAADVAKAIARLETRIAVLEAENSALRTRLGE